MLPSSPMREELLELEKSSRLLEPTVDERQKVRGQVVEYTETFLNKIESLNAFNPPGDKGLGLLDSPISETGIGIDEVIGLMRENIDTPGLNPASGGHFGYIP